jgi:hypothetical protein
MAPLGNAQEKRWCQERNPARKPNRVCVKGKLGEGDKTISDIKMAIALHPALARNIMVDAKPVKWAFLESRTSRYVN